MRYEACIGFDEPLLASLGLEKSKRRRLAPGIRYTIALKRDSHTGHEMDGKLSSSRLTVTMPSVEW